MISSNDRSRVSARFRRLAFREISRAQCEKARPFYSTKITCLDYLDALFSEFFFFCFISFSYELEKILDKIPRARANVLKKKFCFVDNGKRNLYSIDEHQNESIRREMALFESFRGNGSLLKVGYLK